jgi:hypothetical protein
VVTGGLRCGSSHAALQQGAQRARLDAERPARGPGRVVGTGGGAAAPFVLELRDKPLG